MQKINASKTQREAAALARLQQSYSAIYQPEDTPRSATHPVDKGTTRIDSKERLRDASPNGKQRKRPRSRSRSRSPVRRRSDNNVVRSRSRARNHNRDRPSHRGVERRR